LRVVAGFGLGILTPKGHHPGGGRGPIGKVGVTKRCVQLAAFPNWAPACAGVV
jgi:TolB protein